MIGFAGDSHMAAIMRSATHIKGLPTCAKDFDKCDLVFIAQDVNSDADLAVVKALTAKVFAEVPENVPVVITSQVPVGFTNQLPRNAAALFYQVDTIIMNVALERAVNPEQIIVGEACAASNEPLPESYMAYLKAFDVPIVRMSYTEAELTKHAVNFYLAAQLSATMALKAISDKVGANWNCIVPALRYDKRIGLLAYITPPDSLIGGHLPRDVFRLQKIENSYFTDAIAKNCVQP